MIWTLLPLAVFWIVGAAGAALYLAPRLHRPPEPVQMHRPHASALELWQISQFPAKGPFV